MVIFYCYNCYRFRSWSFYRSLAQANSGSYLEEESSYAKSAPASQSRAFLNPPLVTSNLALGVGASSRGLPGSVVPPTVIPRPPVPTPTFLNDAAPMGSLSSASTDLYGRSKLNPNAAVFNPSYNVSCIVHCNIIISFIYRKMIYKN